MAYAPLVNDLAPQGLFFEDAFLNADEERMLLLEVDQLEFHDIVMRGVRARRQARHFGLDYNYDLRKHVEKAEAMKPWLE
jgi:hypothetical protein